MNNKWTPVIIALTIGLIALIIYVYSGRSSLDLETRQLTVNGAVENIDVSEQNRVTVTCKNGDSYQIIFTEQHSDYTGLIFDSCGPEGGEVSRQ